MLDLLASTAIALSAPLAGQPPISSGYSEMRVAPVFGPPRPHRAIDFAAPLGTPVYAAISGKVVYAGWARGYGNLITIQNGSEKTLYGHLSVINVKVGQEVIEGQFIGRVGSTGDSTGPHLHFSYHIKDGNQWTSVNPLPLLNKLETTTTGN